MARGGRRGPPATGRMGRMEADVPGLAGRLARLPELPALAAGGLGLAAMVETIVRGAVPDALLPAALLLAVCATAPVVLVRSRPMSAAAIATGAAAAAL